MNRVRFRLAPLLIFVAILAFKYISAERVVNPETGERSRVGLSRNEEAALGLQSYREVLSQSHVVRSGHPFDQVTRVAKRLIPATGKGGADFDWDVSVVDSDQVNAFCLPGGKIVVYTGLLPVARDDASLAAVMGHEMAHATLRHGGQRIYQHDLLQTAMLGASASLGDLEPRQRQTIIALLGAGAQFGLALPFSRKHETEADAIGLLYMARAGYDPRAAIGFWQRMSEVSGGAQPPEFMSTHPAHASRIRDLEKAMPMALEAYRQNSVHPGESVRDDATRSAPVGSQRQFMFESRRVGDR